MVDRAAVRVAIFLACVAGGCAPTATALYDYRWHIIEAISWQPEFRAEERSRAVHPGTGLVLRWSFENAGRRQTEFTAHITIWRYPLDTVLVVTKNKEPMPGNGVHEVTRLYYRIRGEPLSFDVIVIPRQENTILLTPGKYFVHVSPGPYSDIRIKEVIVREHQRSVVKLVAKEQRFDVF